MKSFYDILTTSYAFNRRALNIYHSQWEILRKLYETNYVNLSEKDFSVLPKKIHQIWLGSKLPEKYKYWTASWQELNPDWEYKLWTDDNVDEVIMENRTFYNSISNYGPKSDFLRYHILNQFGGLYVDTDFECVKSFDPLTFASFITGIGYPMKPELYVGLIASIPHHPITERLVTEISKGASKIEIARVFDATSSYFFTRIFFDIVKDYMPGVIPFPFNYLYPFPNNKDRKHHDGRKFVEEDSFAIHYWEVSWTIKSGNSEWIRGEKFWEIADMIYTPKNIATDDYSKLKNTFDPSKIKDITIIYTHTLYVEKLFQIIQHLNGKFIIITHNSDINITTSDTIPDNVIAWFGQNITVDHPRMIAIPIGLQNTMWDKKLLKRTIMVEELKRKVLHKKLVYIRHSVKTNTIERNKVNVLKGKSWVTFEENEVSFDKFIKQLHSHKFVVCPEGNGIDTHRLWESLYMGAIPIVIRNSNTKQFSDLPICYVSDWGQVTEEFLNKEYERISSINWDLSKLNFWYWRNLVIKTKQNGKL